MDGLNYIRGVGDRAFITKLRQLSSLPNFQNIDKLKVGLGREMGY